MLAKGDKSKPDPQQTLHAMFTALNAFYKHLMDEEYCYGNPIQIAKKDCRYFIKGIQVKDVKRSSEEQWEYVLAIALSITDNNSRYEKNCF